VIAAGFARPLFDDLDGTAFVDLLFQFVPGDGPIRAQVRCRGEPPPLIDARDVRVVAPLVCADVGPRRRATLCALDEAGNLTLPDIQMVEVEDHLRAGRVTPGVYKVTLFIHLLKMPYGQQCDPGISERLLARLAARVKRPGLQWNNNLFGRV
jgi:hypothetical protein